MNRFLKTLVIVVLLVQICCMTDRKKIKVDDDLEFLNSNKFTESSLKTDVPKEALNILREREPLFELGDMNDLKYVFHSDQYKYPSDYEYNLHFVLFSDSACLISYLKYGENDVLAFINFKGEVKHDKFFANPADFITTDKVKAYLTNQITK